MQNKSSSNISMWISVPLSLLCWLLAIFFTVACFILGLFTMAPLSLMFSRKTRHLIHLVAVSWAKCIVWTSPVWSFRVQGQENIDSSKRYVIVANHQSLLDILVCLGGIPTSFKFLAKRELFSIPFIGWHMSIAGYIPLDRSSRESGRTAILTARRWIQRGTSVLFYPEGTRSVDGEIKAFKLGAFKIAAEEGVEVLPVVIEGTGDAVPKKSFFLRKVTQFNVSIGKPVPVLTKSPDEILKIKDEIRNEMINRLHKIREGK